MESLAKAQRENAILASARLRLAELMDEVTLLTKQIAETCPHKLSNQVYSEWTNEDTYGRSSGPTHSEIKCKGCGKILVRDGAPC